MPGASTVLPQSPTRPLTDDEVEAFWADGVVHLAGVLPLEWVAALEAPVDRVVGSGEAADLGALAGSDAGAPAFAAGVDHWRHDGTLRAFALESPLGELAAGLLRSAAVHLWEDSVLVKEPGSPFETKLHTDAAYFHLRGTQVCTVWAPLDAATAASGMVHFVRGSHRDGTDYRPNLFVTDEPIPGTVGATVPDLASDPALTARLVTFDVVPGDVTVHHARTMHGAPANSTAARRRAVSVRYCGDDAVYEHREGLPDRPGLDEVRDGDPIGPPWCPRAWPRERSTP